MRPMRLLAILILIVSALASFALAAAGCGGDNGATDDMGPTLCTTRGTTAINVTCASDCDCVDAEMICTLQSYDRKTMPVCTYTCDLASPNPKCPMGCNPKGFCKLP